MMHNEKAGFSLRLGVKYNWWYQDTKTFHDCFCGTGLSLWTLRSTFASVKQFSLIFHKALCM